MSTYTDILSSLKRKQYAPVYFLYGEEPYYIDLVSDYIEQNVLDEMAREFDQMVVYGKDYERDMGPIISAARRYPMMGEKQVIIVKEAQNIRSYEPLALYMQQMMPTTLLVFCYKYGKPDKRLKVFKDFEKSGGVMMESEKVSDYKIHQWILNYIQDWNRQHKDDNVVIDEKVVALLADCLGNDLGKIVNELNRLVSGRPAGVNKITAELVERNIGISKDFNIFELQEAIIEKEHLKANRIVRYFAQSKTHPIQREMIVLFGFFQNLMLYHYLPDKSQYIAAKALGIAPFQCTKLAKAAQKYTPGKVFKIIGYFRDIDARSKGINNPSVTELELWQELLYKIMH